MTRLLSGNKQRGDTHYVAPLFFFSYFNFAPTISNR